MLLEALLGSTLQERVSLGPGDLKSSCELRGRMACSGFSFELARALESSPVPEGRDPEYWAAAAAAWTQLASLSGPLLQVMQDGGQPAEASLARLLCSCQLAATYLFLLLSKLNRLEDVGHERANVDAAAMEAMLGAGALLLGPGAEALQRCRSGRRWCQRHGTEVVEVQGELLSALLRVAHSRSEQAVPHLARLLPAEALLGWLSVAADLALAQNVGPPLRAGVPSRTGVPRQCELLPLMPCLAPSAYPTSDLLPC